MVVIPDSHNASVVCWRYGRDGVIEFLVIDSEVTHADYYGPPIQTKFPGGGGEGGENPEATARREFRHETGFWARQKAPMHLLISQMILTHHKTAFLVYKGDCRGTLLKQPGREKDSIIRNRRWVPITQVLDVLYYTPRNRIQRQIAQAAIEKLKELGFIKPQQEE